ncbi:MAG TPA: sugar ABC transporter ATP-binding protein [Conexibacter sp.]|nr:sugar ABC transporter ATP-binding protein [Conexibacter sp.]
MSAAPLLQALEVRKSFGATQALKGVDFELRAGEVHALLGPNGAGKSTLVKVIAGALRPDAGRLLLGGEELGRIGPAAAHAAGIETMLQQTALIPDLSVAENVALGRRGGRGFVDWRAQRRDGAAALAALGLDLRLEQPVGELSIADQRAVELARALSRRCRVLILDEPTATLGAREARVLLEQVRRTAAEGVGVVYVSHHLDEVLEVADRATVVRDGRVVEVMELRRDGVQARDLVRAMIGREVEVAQPPALAGGGAVALEAQAVTVGRRLLEVSLTLRRGEIVGLFGAVGAGQSTLARVLSGQTRPSAGSVAVDGRPLRVRTPRGALRRGVALVPEDRLRSGLVPAFDIAENIQLSARALGRGVLARRRLPEARRWVADLGIHPSDPTVAVSALSGGNQQKVVFAKTVASGGRVLVLEEPTAGVDVGAKQEIRALVGRLAGNGAAVAIVSTEPEEVLAMCHRIVVLRKGSVVAELPREAATRQKLTELATGAEAER